MATLAELRAAFRVETGDTISAGYLFGDPEVNGWLNESVREACVRTDLIIDESEPTVTQVAVLAGDVVIAVSPLITKLRFARLAYAAGTTRYLDVVTRENLDRLNPTWRDYNGEPDYCLFDSAGKVRLAGAASAAGTLKLEVARLPLAAMTLDADTPEIGAAYHDGLIYWALHRAYMKRDPDTYDKARADEYAATFAAYYGPRPNADAREKFARGGRHTTRMRF